MGMFSKLFGSSKRSSKPHMAELLMRAGYKGEAREALQVVLLFPSYAGTYFASADATGQVTDTIVERTRQALAALSLRANRWP